MGSANGDQCRVRGVQNRRRTSLLRVTPAWPTLKRRSEHDDVWIVEEVAISVIEVGLRRRALSDENAVLLEFQVPVGDGLAPGLLNDLNTIDEKMSRNEAPLNQESVFR